ncbi:MAG TPA: chromosome segregation protein SMC [Segeticoccus sp.]|uniref:chromosome segregation protein SMC n=1 Tax=Segeticoccus sp. TaxID=2706531 RepID=UPI002D802BA9|nr:chromosome segregation protein SMC [Segeticoccus sp.]HET8601570.1 chromosome segregation protein SMC [Segeticoccus sp.]
MYVKSLTVKGFKSFASATSMKLEPGITCIVGPNGSGKSNVVDALAWVMGEQGAKSLRGGKMEDVIFAGTAGRPPLGRAEVALTIDNGDGALPIDYTEVTIARTMFRNGGSEYAINGTSCRLLDIQELLSDSGIGREMHVIVGQGQLDAILRATPEERRGFIEEAAGVLKHRKRKERALRKLDQMEANLTRVTDLTGEIRRQLGPLGRQAETARKAAVIQADVRDARLRLLADDLVQLTSTLEQEVADESALVARRTEVEQALQRAQSGMTELERAAELAAPELTRAQEEWFALSALQERLRSTGSLAAERVRLLSQDEEDPEGEGRDPEQLRGQAAQVREQERALEEEIDQARAALEEAVAGREQAESAHAEEQQRLARLARAAADRREGLARLAGQVAARRSRIEAGEAEIGRLRENGAQSTARATEAENEFTRLEASIAADEQGEEGLDSAYEDAAAALERAEAELEEWREKARTADRDRQTLGARLEALELGLRRKDGAEALLAAGEEVPGVVGSVSALLQVDGGHEAAVAAALGWAADALAVDSLDHARSALQRLRADDAGRAGLLVGATAARDAGAESSRGPLPEGVVAALDVVSCPEQVRPAITQLLAGVVLVPAAEDDATLAQVSELVAEGHTAVTPEGDVFAPGFARGGSSSAPSLIEIQAAVDEARERQQEAVRRGEEATFAQSAAEEKVRAASEVVEEALERLHDSDAKMSAVAERLGQLGATMRAARAERERSEHAVAEAREALEAGKAELAELEERLAAAQEDPGEEEPDAAERDRLAEQARTCRATETEVRLTLRTREERARALHGRADSLEAAARAELQARERRAARRERRRREAAVATAVQRGAGHAAERVGASLELAAAARARAEQERAGRERGLAEVRRQVASLGDELRELTDTVHRDEVARTQQRLRIEALQTKAVEELGIEPEALTEEYGPHQLIPPIPGADEDGKGTDAEPPRPRPFVREEQEKRLRRAERKLNQLGKVNPLALEEYAALEERHKFLTEQLEDLKSSKRDLLDIVREVDERVERVFADAYADTAAQFEGVFGRLFPGGEGRLVLTDPGNMLTTGIEVEARPPGKKIKRLSLLSGGERSLVAVALLVSIFKARPSPFYIMDEVEAALDDANLGRLITLFEELRDSSQLIVITHQKRTMEIADALYGVSMRGDGVTTVVSQRLRDLAPGDGPSGPGGPGEAEEADPRSA